MSFLNQLRVSVESANLYEGPVTALEEMEAEEAMAEVEETVAENNNNLEQVERADAVVDELENTNEAIQGAVARDAFTPEVAAMAEAQRRTAAAALGLNPEEGAGAELVDQAGLESMVNNPGTISLEENKTMIQKIKDFIQGIIDRIKEGWNKFTDLLGRIFRVLPSQIRQLTEFFNNKDNLNAVSIWVGKKKKEEMKNILKDIPYIKGEKAYGLPGAVNSFVDESNKVIKSLADAKDREGYEKAIASYPTTTIIGHYYNISVGVKDGQITVEHKEVKTLEEIFKENESFFSGIMKVAGEFVDAPLDTLKKAGKESGVMAANVDTIVRLLNEANAQIKTIQNDNKFGKNVLGMLNNVALKVVQSSKETKDMSWMRLRMINSMRHSSLMDTIRKDGIKSIRALVKVAQKIRAGAESVKKD